MLPLFAFKNICHKGTKTRKGKNRSPSARRQAEVSRWPGMEKVGRLDTMAVPRLRSGASHHSTIDFWCTRMVF